MRVDAPPALASLARQAGTSARASDARPFTVNPAQTPAQPPASILPGSPTLAASSMAGLLALQSQMPQITPRQAAVQRGKRSLDLLDELKLALIDGDISSALREHMSALLCETRPETDDPGLSALLDQIDLRLSVELAKIDRGNVR